MVQRRIDAEDDARLAAGLEEARARRTAESARRRVRREQEAQEQEAEQRQRDEWMRWEQLVSGCAGSVLADICCHIASPCRRPF